MTFLMNCLLILAVIIFFYNTRHVSEEYFIRNSVNEAFERESMLYVIDDITADIELQPFSTIKS